MSANTAELPPVYALRVIGETKAANQLAEIGVSAWSLTYKRVRPGVYGKGRMVDEPLIPGYVFARLDIEDFAKALAVERVFGILRRDGAPAPVPEADWISVLLMVLSGRFDERTPATKARPRGERKRKAMKLREFVEALEAGQLKSTAKHGSLSMGGELVSDGPAGSSQRSTRNQMTAARAA